MTDKAPPRPRRAKKGSSQSQTKAGTMASGDGLDEVRAAPQYYVGADEHVVDDTDYTGTQLTVHWGREHIQPMKFQGMDLGPFSMEVVVHKGETPFEASRRAMRHMNQMAEAELGTKLPRFIQRCKGAAVSDRLF